MSLFDTYKTENNRMAKVVRSAAGGYLSMSNNLSQRRLCYMHQLTVIKPCEVPQCTRWLFPTTHQESEMIGKVHWISGDYTQMLTQDLKVRPFGILYACKLCLTRSQCTIRAKQLLKDLKADVDEKRARDDAARQVKGIAEVPIVKVPVTEVIAKKCDDAAGGLEIDEELETEADLLSACSPPKFEIRSRPMANNVLSRSGEDKPESSQPTGFESKFGADRNTKNILEPLPVVVNKGDADKDASESLNEAEQDEVEQDGFDEVTGDSLVFDYEEFNEFNEYNELNDAQSLGVESNDEFDDAESDDGELDDTEGYVPVPMSEEQLAEQLSETRDYGD